MWWVLSRVADEQKFMHWALLLYVACKQQVKQKHNGNFSLHIYPKRYYFTKCRKIFFEIAWTKNEEK
jgi:hypothetical protein